MELEDGREDGREVVLEVARRDYLAINGLHGQERYTPQFSAKIWARYSTGDKGRQLSQCHLLPPHGVLLPGQLHDDTRSPVTRPEQKGHDRGTDWTVVVVQRTVPRPGLEARRQARGSQPQPIYDLMKHDSAQA